MVYIINMTDESNIIYLSDDKIFYTIEGEGEFIGYPSVFMRMSMCNLTCKGFVSADSPNGCDSFVSWSVKNRMTFNEIFEYMSQNAYNCHLKDGAIFKLTGGEPLIQQKTLLRFIDAYKQRYGYTPIIDFETNATVLPDEEWVTKHKATFTTSPKLASNGDPEERRYKPAVLKWHVNNNSGFKFVVRNEDDVKEIMEKYIHNDDIKVPATRVWLMPCCGSRQEHIEKAAEVAALCKKYNFNFSPRLQLIIWDKALKV
jgi:organic radical activating enzyme